MASPNPKPNLNPNISTHWPETSETSYKRHRPAKVRKVNENVVKVYVWELPVRIFHWINAFSIILLMITGIYIGKPFLGATIPEEAYYSSVMWWVRYIHFFTAFVFTINLLFRWYWVYKGNKYAASNPFRKVFWVETWETVKFYLFLKNKKPHYVGHNPLAQLSYWIFIGLGSLIMVFTGYFLYVEPQPDSFLGSLFFSWVPVVFGGDSFTIRSLHHLVAWGFMIFIVIHVYMSFREDYLTRNGTMSSIVTGYKVEPEQSVGDENEK